MKRGEQIRFHRYAVEIGDQRFLRRLRDEYVRYSGIISAKKQANPTVEFEELSLAKFTLQILDFGLGAMGLLLDRKVTEAIRKGIPENAGP